DADLGSSLLFLLYVGNGGRIFADADKRDTWRPRQLPHLVRQFGDDLRGDFVSVNYSRTHWSFRPLRLTPTHLFDADHEVARSLDGFRAAVEMKLASEEMLERRRDQEPAQVEVGDSIARRIDELELVRRLKEEKRTRFAQLPFERPKDAVGSDGAAISDRRTGGLGGFFIIKNDARLTRALADDRRDLVGLGSNIGDERLAERNLDPVP